jgi:undecaprenyl diphosphate synthase
VRKTGQPIPGNIAKQKSELRARLRGLRACVSFAMYRVKTQGTLRTCACRARRRISGYPNVNPPELLQPANRDEARLLDQLDALRLPKHIAIIMDGNGRWAERRHFPRVAGHRAGVETARNMIETCARLNLPALTLYAFSLENWRRPKAEIDFLMRLLRQYLKTELPSIHRNNIRLQVIGRTDQLPEGVRVDVEKGMALTAANTGMCLTVALNYGGRAELVDAFNAILQHVRGNGANGHGLATFRVDEQMIADHLYTAGLPDPDLLIRTSGEMRVSNFLLWQIAYAEIYVTETLWPDFSRAEFYAALVDYQKRERRYGGLADTTRRVKSFALAE